jgi:hypothetical protein
MEVALYRECCKLEGKACPETRVSRWQHGLNRRFNSGKIFHYFSKSFIYIFPISEAGVQTTLRAGLPMFDSREGQQFLILFVTPDWL